MKYFTVESILVSNPVADENMDICKTLTIRVKAIEPMEPPIPTITEMAAALGQEIKDAYSSVLNKMAPKPMAPKPSSSPQKMFQFLDEIGMDGWR